MNPFQKRRFDIILPSTSKSPNCRLPLSFYHLAHVWYMFLLSAVIDHSCKQKCGVSTHRFMTIIMLDIVQFWNIYDIHDVSGVVSSRLNVIDLIVIRLTDFCFVISGDGWDRTGDHLGILTFFFVLINSLFIFVFINHYYHFEYMHLRRYVSRLRVRV